MNEDMKTLVETKASETNREQINRLYDAVQKYFEIIEVVQKALGVASVSHDDKEIKLPVAHDLTQLQSQELVRNETDSKLDYQKCNITKQLAEQKEHLAILKSAASQSDGLKEWSRKLKARSLQLTATSSELNIFSEDLVARSRSARESKHYKIPGGAP